MTMFKHRLFSSTNKPRRLALLASAAMLLALSVPALAGSWQPVVVSSVYSPGETATIPNSDPNDAVLFLNGPDSAWGDYTELTATIVHDGFLNTSSGLDHIAVSIRGASLEQMMAAMGYGANTPWKFTFGEYVSQAAASGQLSTTALHRALSGRGPTFWPKGHPLCSDNRYPCLVFENYTVNLSGPGLVCQSTSMSNPCGYDVALPISTANFEIRVVADNWDTTTMVTQGGNVIANVSCRTRSGNDARCGMQSGDAAQGDAFFGNVVANTGPGSSGRRLGAINASVRVMRFEYVCAWYERNCQIP